jgi:PAS domain S-box-containing protein
MASSTERRFWALWSAGLGFGLIVRFIYLVNPQVDSLASGAVSIDVLYVLFYLALILSLQVRPDRLTSDQERSELRLLEAAGTAVFVLALLAYFTVVPNTLNPEEYGTWVPSLLLYWVLDAFLFLTLVYLRNTSASREWRILYSWLAMAPLLWATTEILELLFYIEWQGQDWTTAGYLDVFWYLPWFFITVAGRVRARPVPALMGAPKQRVHMPRAAGSLGRPGSLVVMGMTLPVIHFGSNLLDLLDPATRDPRESVVLVAVVLLLGTAFIHQKLLGRHTVALARRSQELEERQRLLATAVEQAPDPMLIADANGRIQYANPIFWEAERNPDELLGCPLEDALPPTLVGITDTTLASSLKSGEAWEGRNRTRTPDEVEREELVTVSPVRGTTGGLENWAVVRKDVTYLSQLERQFRQAQKMEALGTLAGGIAHDFNNILGAIYGYVEVLRDEMDSESTSQEHLKGLFSAAERAGSLVRQILSFSRQAEEEQERFELEPVVREAIALLKATLPSTIQIRAELDENVGAILGRKHQIEQIVLNLGTNAGHAMGDKGGFLRVGLDNVQLHSKEVEEWGLPAPGNFARISVGDSGVGMDETTLARMFDPFFTTKEVGKGTGLGLSVVHGIVASHGGVVRVQSKLGKGTTFDVYLPVVESQMVAEEVEERAIPTGIGGRLLLVDDEPMLVTLAERMLTGLGYEVTAFTVSTEALAVFKDDPDGIDALITDHTMPGMTGLELAAAAREIRADLPILLTSGYSEALDPDRSVDAHVNGLLMKPYTRAELGQAVVALLSERAKQ